MDRVSGNDESYLLAEKIFGLSAPIQYCWIFPDDPGADALQSLNAQLAQGILARKVVRARVPFARARWVRHDEAPHLRRHHDPVDDASTARWFDARVRTTVLDPVSGYGWQLDWVVTCAGRVLVSLIVSHMTSDGQGIYRALAAAAAATSTNPLQPESVTRGLRGLADDGFDAGTQIAAAARSVLVLSRAAWASRRQSSRPSPSPDELAHAAQAPVAPASGVGEPTLALYDLDRAQWATRAQELGGTSNSLFTGVIGGLVRRAGLPTPGDVMRICIAVSKREGDDDDRANASGGVWIRVAGDIGPEAGLGTIRTLSKQAFVDYATTGDQQVADNIAPVVRLLPRPVIGRMMRSLTGPDMTVSNLGEAPDSALTIGGVRAQSFVIRALMQGQPASVRREKGPALAAWAVEYDDKVTIAFFGINPDHFGDSVVLHEQIAAELDRWHLSHTPW